MNAALSALSWLVESGADEAILAAPVDRFSLSKTVPKPSQIVVDPQSKPVAPTAQSKVPPAATSAAGENTARKVAQAAASLADLKAAIERFDGGRLKAAAQSTVFSDGVAGAPVMLVGEAPGQEEDCQGKPFVGRSGQLLDDILRWVGLERARNVYISNIVPWRPTNNRTPSPEEVAMCLPFIRRHIELAAPKFLVLLGGTAAKAFDLAPRGITKARGSWHELNGGVPTLVTFHPAYLLRRPEDKGAVWKDFLMLSDRLRGLDA